MPLRLIEIITPKEDKDEVEKTLESQRTDEGYVFWSAPLEKESSLSFRMILDVQESENVLDKLENIFTWTSDYRIVIYPVEATLPRLETIEKNNGKNGKNSDGNGNDSDSENGNGDNNTNKIGRISREELYTDILDTSLFNYNYVLLVFLSTIVAVIGLLRNNVAVIIGAMVLAPLLGPNVGLCLAATLRDAKLAVEALKTLLAGTILSLGIAYCIGWAVDLPPISPELMLRSSIDFYDILLAIISGTAGIISFTLGVPTSLVGVMVALALLPPLSACGLFLGAGLHEYAAGAAILFVTNIICLNLAGVVTFILQGVLPLPWRKRKQARSTALRIACFWGLLLLILTLLLYFELIKLPGTVPWQVP